jgi:N-acetylmuramoyl-L-alanine amidase
MTAIDTLARTLYGEARGEGFDGRVAVAWVVANRFRKNTWYGGSITEVCRKPWQFSCWNANDPNLPKLKAVDELDPLFAECIGIAGLVYAAVFGRIGALPATMKDPTSGATHYHVSTMTPPWAVNKVPVCQIGRHKFYNDIQ